MRCAKRRVIYFFKENSSRNNNGLNFALVIGMAFTVYFIGIRMMGENVMIDLFVIQVLFLR